MTNGMEVLNLPTVGAAVVIIGGVFTAIGYATASFSRGSKEAKKDADEEKKNASEVTRDANEATNFVINALKLQIEQLEKKVELQATDIKENSKRLEELSQENAMLRQVLQGRDAQTQKFQEEGFKAMQQSALTIGSVSVIEARVNKILDIIEHREVVVTKIHKDIQEVLDKNKK